MELSVKGKQIDVGDSLREHVSTRLSETVGKFFNESINAQVTFSRDAHLFCADIVVHAGRNITLQSNASLAEPYPAFDAALDRLSERLRRYKTKLKGHRPDVSGEAPVMASSFVLDNASEEEVGDNPVVVAEMTTPIELLTVSEAVMRLDLGNLPALMFKNRANGSLNMIYRRADGNIGWVDPSLPAASCCSCASGVCS